ncbi:hypothetical protein SLS53_006246 [Cytospora paraplurivora]|uniref:Uncharacterized protein n=1 Tax=Cytospora paraplurivora TaxID=2898453 RepID=A0AAN9U3V8_9PEZI
MSAWHPRAPLVRSKYDDATGKVYYSLCNSIKTPVFAFNDTTTFDFDVRYPPLNGTSIAGVGYAYGAGDDNPDVIQSPFFYLTDLEDVGVTIVEALFTCNRTTGHWYHPADAGAFSWPLSNGTFTTDDRHVPIPDIHPRSGLAALYIGTTGGHRIYFKSTNGTTHYIKYKSQPGPEYGWNYGGMVSSNYPLLPGMDIAAAFASSEADPDPDNLKLRVAYGVPAKLSASDDVSGEIEWAVSGIDEQEAIWEINRLPTTLSATPLDDRNETNATVLLSNMTSSNTDYAVSFGPSLNMTLQNYSGSSSRLGMSMDAKANPSIWYIGSDASPHLYSGDATGNWTQSPSQDGTKWPIADTPYAELAVVSDAKDQKVWLFYVVGGDITMLASDSGDWDDPVALIPFNSTTEAKTAGSSSPVGLSSSSKIGIGVGVGVGVPLVLAALAFFVCVRIRRSRQARAQQQETGFNATPKTGANPTAPLSSVTGTPVPQYKPGLDIGHGGHWMDGAWVPSDHPGISPYTTENKPLVPQMEIADTRTANAYTGIPVVESDSAQVYELGHDERSYEMPVTTGTMRHDSLDGQDEGRAGDGLAVSADGRPRAGRMMEQL